MGKQITTSLGNKTRFRQLVDSFGLPRIIITGFLLLLFISAPIVGADFATQLTNTINRFSWNAVLVLAMVPMIHSGCGLNFGLPLGIVSGLLGATLSIELGFTGAMSFVMAIVISTPFALLFGGGSGKLELMEDADILEAGVRVIAQPPGKKLVNMMQMSGGEKSLTAISLLFAIQSLKPSPFCLLDEIEAALDDSNVKRFAKYLGKLTKDTQFIVITHRKGTMEAADILYGITMQEKGVSTLVSVNMIENELDD